jgi:biopolymer transport protein ExbB
LSDVLDFLVSGGPVMVPIGLASVVAMAALMERVVALRTSRIVPHGFAVEVTELLNQGRYPDAVTLCRKSDSSVARIVEVAILARGRTRAEIKERLEELGRREAAGLEQYSQVLGTVASVAPLLGLLGTVWGMILTFEVIQQEGLGGVANLAGGISQALITTMAGLSVGIPTLIAYKWVLSRADELVLEMEEIALSVLDKLVDAEDAA